MVFAGPPEDDVDWADVSPAGSARFLARAWRLARDVTSPVGADPTDRLRCRCAGSPTRCVSDAATLVEGLRFNVAVARTMELVNALRKAIDDPAVGPARPGRPRGRRGGRGPAEPGRARTPPRTCGPTLGHEPCVARAGWPAVDDALLVEDTVTAVVQVMGKVRDRLEVPPGIGEDELRELAMASEKVVASIGGATVRRVVVRPPSLVNVVTG